MNTLRSGQVSTRVDRAAGTAYPERVEPVRWVHLTSAVLWPASAMVGLWWARAVGRPWHRRWLYAICLLALVIGGENLLQAMAAHHPRSAAHLVANLALAAAGVGAVFAVAAGGRGIATEERVLRALSGGRLGDRSGARRPAPLTPRETEVITCLCRGLSTDEIAHRLQISPHTATTHIRNIRKKLGVGCRADAVAWAVERGLPDAIPHPRIPRGR